MALDLDIEKFIDCVRNRPPLWNQQDPMYRNAERKIKLWTEVSQEMGNIFKTRELKQKWHNLRDVFRREKKLLNSKNTAKKKRWYYYNNMLFLSSQICKNYQNNSHDKSQDGPAPDEMSTFKTKVESRNYHNNSIDKYQDGSAPDEMSTYKTKVQEDQETEYLGQANSDLIDNDNIEMINCTPYTDIEHRSHADFSENDDYHFAMSIIPHMRQVPMHKKLKMRIKISEIINEELKCSWSNTVGKE